jgi:hypothetical protein
VLLPPESGSLPGTAARFRFPCNAEAIGRLFDQQTLIGPLTALYSITMEKTVERSWRVEAIMAFPTEIPLAPGGGLPERIEPQSRVPSQTHDVCGTRVGLRPATDAEAEHREQHPNFSWGTMIAEVTAPEAAVAYERAVDAMEAVVESLSFQIQSPLQIHGIEAIDVTPPVEVGDDREFGQLTGYPLRRFRPASLQMTGVWTQVVPDLGVELATLDRRQRAALDWYLKALAAPYQVDQFMFFWIALEILSDLSPVKVEGPLIARCQHEIAQCPTCGKPTTRVVQGASRQRYLMEGFGIPEQLARELWKTRQILHGAEEFDSSVMDRLAELSQVLRAVVNAAIKDALGLPPDAPPIVQYGQTAISPHMGLGGTRRVEQSDLDWPDAA